MIACTRSLSAALLMSIFQDVPRQAAAQRWRLELSPQCWRHDVLKEVHRDPGFAKEVLLQLDRGAPADNGRDLHRCQPLGHRRLGVGQGPAWLTSKDRRQRHKVEHRLGLCVENWGDGRNPLHVALRHPAKTATKRE